MTLREIDATISKSVMDDLCECQIGEHGESVHGTASASGRCQKCWKPQRRYVPYFSTDPVASKALRDKLAELGWNYELGRYGSEPCFYTFVLTRPGERIEMCDENEG